jgi:DnaJ family protein A protein 2
MPVETELYETLEVSPTASQAEIKKAYRKLALIHHPDKGGNQETFKKITAAHEILSDEEKRQVYDTHGKNGLQHSGAVPEDMFASLFGDLGATFGGGFGGVFNMFQNARNAVRRTQPVVYQRAVSLEELCTRKVINIKVTRDRVCNCQKIHSNQSRCSDCNGQGRIVRTMMLGPGIMQQSQAMCGKCKGSGMCSQSCDECKNGIVEEAKVFNIHLTPDMGNGYQYKFAGEGNELPGVLPGDFIVVVAHKPHEQFQVNNMNLVYHRKTTLLEALCGYDSLVLHPSGENVELSFKGVIPPNGEKEIVGKGMDTGGNLVIIHDIVFPEELSAEKQKKLKKILS